jgi:DNA gyrase/topoisomerase IV subunit B
LDPTKRRLVQLTVPDADKALITMTELLGDDPSARYRLITEHANEVRDLDV